MPVICGWIWGDVAPPARLCARDGGESSRALLVGRDAERHQCLRFILGYGETLRLWRARGIVTPPEVSIESGVQEGLRRSGRGPGRPGGFRFLPPSRLELYQTGGLE